MGRRLPNTLNVLILQALYGLLRFVQLGFDVIVVRIGLLGCLNVTAVLGHDRIDDFLTPPAVTASPQSVRPSLHKGAFAPYSSSAHSKWQISSSLLRFSFFCKIDGFLQPSSISRCIAVTSRTVVICPAKR